jgi:hypothetical protein
MSGPDLNSIDHIIDIARGATAADEADRENRHTRRVDYDNLVVLVQLTPEGRKSIPIMVRCRNISAGGMCILSRYMLHVGYEGAILMMRSDGQPVILPAKVVHCKYAGEMMHESGIEFIEPSVHFEMGDFRDAHGNMPQLGPPKAA